MSSEEGTYSATQLWRTRENMVHRDKQCVAITKRNQNIDLQLVTPDVLSAMLLLFGTVSACTRCDPNYVRPDKGRTYGPPNRYPRMLCPGCGKDSAIEYQHGSTVRLFSHTMPTGETCSTRLHPDDARVREEYELEGLMEQ